MMIHTEGVPTPHLMSIKVCSFQIFLMFLNSGSTRFLSALQLSVVADLPAVYSEFLLIELLALQVLSA
jgi:hypothetical protein